ncbi:MAG: FAD-dependent oxidoreductase [candidate division Zixibacteria bacterium]|nr:FAD-dependent oxidoreductase [candidate division Zixibacteria bacterium]
MKKVDVAIVGGGPAGRVIVHSLHKEDQKYSIALFKDEEINVNRCAVPYGINGKKQIEKYQIDNKLITDFGAELIISKVEKINPEEDIVILDDGRKFHYQYLVLATGASPSIPPIKGVELPDVVTVRSIDDLYQLRNKATSKKLNKVIIIGGGFIGVEVAAELRIMGFEVIIIEATPQILVPSCEPEFSEPLSQILRDKGIDLKTKMRVNAFRKNKSSELEVQLEDNSVLSCDFAVLATGVQLNTDIAESSGIKTNNFGIICDEYQRTNYKNIFTAGDCAAKISYVTGQQTRGEFGTNAVFTGKIVAQNITGKNRIFHGVINANVTKIFDWSVGSAGLTEKMALDAGFDVITGQSKVLDKYPMIDGVSHILTKLIFDRKSHRLLGGSIMRQGDVVVANVDFLSLAIQMKVTLEDLKVHQYATHPELAAKPSDNLFVFATQDAEQKT